MSFPDSIFREKKRPPGLFALVCAFALVYPSFLFADTLSEGWTWSVGCPGDGTSFTGGSFSVVSSTGFSGSGTCARTTTEFTQFTFTSSSGGTTNSSVMYGVHTGDWLIVPPTLTTESAPIYLVSSVCPWNNKNLTWIFVQWNSSSQILQDTYVLGTASYNTSTGVTVTGQYDVTGTPYWEGSVAMPGTCSNGVYTVSGQSSADLNGTVYFTSDGSGVFKTTPGHATFFFRSTRSARPRIWQTSRTPRG